MNIYEWNNERHYIESVIRIGPADILWKWKARFACCSDQVIELYNEGSFKFSSAGKPTCALCKMDTKPERKTEIRLEYNL